MISLVKKSKPKKVFLSNTVVRKGIGHNWSLLETFYVLQSGTYKLQCVTQSVPPFSTKNLGKVGHFGNIYPKNTIFGLHNNTQNEKKWDTLGSWTV